MFLIVQEYEIIYIIRRKNNEQIRKKKKRNIKANTG